MELLIILENDMCGLIDRLNKLFSFQQPLLECNQNVEHLEQYTGMS